VRKFAAQELELGALSADAARNALNTWLPPLITLAYMDPMTGRFFANFSPALRYFAIPGARLIVSEKVLSLEAREDWFVLPPDESHALGASTQLLTPYKTNLQSLRTAMSYIAKREFRWATDVQRADPRVLNAVSKSTRRFTRAPSMPNVKALEFRVESESPPAPEKVMKKPQLEEVEAVIQELPLHLQPLNERHAAVLTRIMDGQPLCEFTRLEVNGAAHVLRCRRARAEKRSAQLQAKVAVLQREETRKFILSWKRRNIRVERESLMKAGRRVEDELFMLDQFKQMFV